jgi:hypothetical protein
MAEMKRRAGGPETFNDAVRDVAALHDCDVKTVRRALKRASRPDDRGAELALLATAFSNNNNTGQK